MVAALQEALCQRLGEPRFTLWFADKTKLDLSDQQLTIGVPNHFVKEWLEKAFADDLQQAARTVLGRDLALRFTIDPELFQQARRRQAASHPNVHDVADIDTDTGAARSWVRGPGREDQGLEDPSHGDLPAPTFPSAVKSWQPGTTGLGLLPSGERLGLSPTCTQATPVSGAQNTSGLRRDARLKTRRWRRLDDFVVGPCNRVAHACALSVVEGPGQEANPLVFHGAVGTGKTHLLEGIALGLRRSRPDWRVAFATAEEFTHRFVQSMRQSKLSLFRKHYRDCDALLLDDLHFLATRPATQEEFLHTLDAMLADGRQVVVSCDCHPRLAEQFMPELTDRLLGGGIWALALPEQETRLDLLRAKAARSVTSPVSEEVLAHLAEHLRGNVRELEGALHSLNHFSRVTRQRIDLALARQVLGDILRHSVRLVQLADVERAVCQVLRLENGKLQSKQRGWSVAHPRMLAMYLARKHTGATYTEIGQRFGSRNHSTAVAAEKKVRQWLQKDESLSLGDRRLPVRDLIEHIERELLR